MSAASYNMNIDQGADFIVQLTIKDSTGTAIDLTGHLFSGHIRKSISDATIQASLAFTILNQGTDLGRVDVSLSAATSTAILIPSQKNTTRKDVKFAYDIESIDGAGTVVRWLEGQVLLSPEVTRA